MTTLPHQTIASGALGAVAEINDKICVFLNKAYPEKIQERIFCHEIFHIIATNKGYPSIKVNNKSLTPDSLKASQFLENNFRSTIEHPFVFKEIGKLFEADEEYFNIQVQQKLT